MDRSDAERIIRALETFAAAGYGDVKALKGALKGRYRLRVGKWRIFLVVRYLCVLDLFARAPPKPPRP
jgi:mRNA-degrading endonuclease RelE of RelBE toxin-antitoxin system